MSLFGVSNVALWSAAARSNEHAIVIAMKHYFPKEHRKRV